MKNNTLAIALASLLVGGVAVAAFQNNRDDAGSRDVADFQHLEASVGQGLGAICSQVLSEADEDGRWRRYPLDRRAFRHEPIIDELPLRSN